MKVKWYIFNDLACIFVYSILAVFYSVDNLTQTSIFNKLDTNSFGSVLWTEPTNRRISKLAAVLVPVPAAISSAAPLEATYCKLKNP